MKKSCPWARTELYGAEMAAGFRSVAPPKRVRRVRGVGRSVDVTGTLSDAQSATNGAPSKASIIAARRRRDGPAGQGRSRRDWAVPCRRSCARRGERRSCRLAVHGRRRKCDCLMCRRSVQFSRSLAAVVSGEVESLGAFPPHARAARRVTSPRRAAPRYTQWAYLPSVPGAEPSRLPRSVSAAARSSGGGSSFCEGGITSCDVTARAGRRRRLIQTPTDKLFTLHGLSLRRRNPVLAPDSPFPPEAAGMCCLLSNSCLLRFVCTIRLIFHTCIELVSKTNVSLGLCAVVTSCFVI